MALTSSQRRELRARAHSLNPVVQTGGKGLTDAVMREVEAALVAHELIKVRFPGMEREDRRAAAAQISRETRAELVGQIGAVAILFRAKPEKPAPKTPTKSATKRPVRAGTARAQERVPGRRGPQAKNRRTTRDKNPWNS